ncbi:MAG: hypothetical protein A3K66_07120 [Euryarchaeota archaeon RBG_16_67_27]|nr:MAG: hypothetical protein A3K66_07120 [Euryarchaeota archaeon RBG_16_67_27]
MKWVEPKVFKIGETTLDREALSEFLRLIGADEWLGKQDWHRSNDLTGIDVGAALIEVAGRTCYKSFGVGLNPNVTRIREDRKSYLANVIQKGDGSVLEHSVANWLFADVSRVFCYCEDTDVLTDEGWKAWPIVRGDEHFASMTTSGELVFVPAEERFASHYTGPMYHARSQQVDLLVTPNHRMWAKKVDTQAYRRHEEKFALYPATALLHRRVRYQKGGVFWRGRRPALVALPGTFRKYRRKDRPRRETIRSYDGLSANAMAFSRFLGYFTAEGHLGKSDTSINLTQQPGKILDDMATSISELGRPVTNVKSGYADVRRLSFKHVALYDWLRATIGDGALKKRVPFIVHDWPAYLIRVFLDALIRGDGNVHASNGHRVLYTSSKQLADDVQVLALKVGLAANIRVDDRVESHRVFTGATIRKTRPNYIVSFLEPSRLHPAVNAHLSSDSPNRFLGADGFNDHFVPYSGGIYCVKVRHGLLYVRRNGKACWSGNTHELVRHRAGVAISQESLRYVRPKELRMTLVPGSELARLENLGDVTRTLETLERSYFGLTDAIIRPEMKFDEKKGWTSALRRALPDGIATNIVWSANHRTLRWVLEMRTSPGAEVEMRYVFDKVGQILVRDHPDLYGDFERTPHPDGVGAQWVPKLRSKV